MCSVIQYRFKYYNLFKSQLNSDGQFIAIQYAEDSSQHKFIKKQEELSPLLKGVNSIQGMYQLSDMTYDNYHKILGWSYDTALADIYTPALKDGKWLSDDIVNDDTLKACATSDINASVGDIITISEPNYGISIEVEIIGILDEDATVIGFDGGNTSSGTSLDCFVTQKELQNTGIYTPGINIEQTYPVLFFLNDQLTQNKYFDNTTGESSDGHGIQRVLSGPLFVIYNNTITNAEKEFNESIFLYFSQYYNCSLNDMKKKTLSYIFNQLSTLLPVTICILLLTITAIFNVELLSVKEQLRNYAIYYITGMRWTDCIRINLSHEIILHASAIITFVFVYVIGHYFKLFDVELIHLNILVIIAILIISLFDSILALIAPRIILKKTQAVQLLKTN